MTGGSKEKYNIKKIRRETIADFFGAVFLWVTNLVIINSVLTTLNNNFNQQNNSVY